MCDIICKISMLGKYMSKIKAAIENIITTH